jgi:hypothetical protein
MGIRGGGMRCVGEEDRRVNVGRRRGDEKRDGINAFWVLYPKSFGGVRYRPKKLGDVMPYVNIERRDLGRPPLRPQSLLKIKSQGHTVSPSIQKRTEVEDNEL